MDPDGPVVPVEPRGPLAPLVDAGWLSTHLDSVVVADARWYLDGRSGREGYRSGHVAGAVWIDLDTVLAGPPSVRSGRHPLPAPEAFAAGLGAAGIGDDDIVVAYDDSGGTSAARLVWLLRILGSPAALLDGGLAVWPGPRRTGDEARRQVSRSVVPWPRERLATIDEISSVVAGRVVPGRQESILVDARAPERYRGETEPIDPRAGHIPGAVNLPFAENLGPDGRFLGADQLRDRFARAGIEEGAQVIAYCGSGVTACHDLLALEAAGLGSGRLYPGSWSEWSADRGRPAATGPQP
jgi:thiosulfate/3-mercaptopyruvate sulfurtransferase